MDRAVGETVLSVCATAFLLKGVLVFPIWRHYLIRLLFVLFLGSVAVGAPGCKEPSEPNEPADANVAPPAGGTKVSVNPSADAVVERILSGDFAGARQVCSFLNTGGDVRLDQLRTLLDRYEAIKERRSQDRQKALAEQIAELEKLSGRLSGRPAEANDIDHTPVEFEQLSDGLSVQPAEVNDIDRLLAAAVRVREYSDQEQKAMVLERPDVKKAVEQALLRAREFESQGKWIDAYAHGYYWLRLLCEDNKDYKDKLEELTKLASMELSLKDSGCGETVMDRYKGIEPAIFLRAMQILESDYVNKIDFSDMAREGLRQCVILGRVLDESREQLAWKVNAEQAEKWQTGLSAIETGLKKAKNKDAPETLVRAFNEVIALNSVSLNLPDEVVVAQFAEASLESLDPYTNLVWPWFVRDFDKSMTQQFSGIGVEISKIGKVLKIGSLLPDTPAYRAGLDAGDEILAVNGQSTEPITIFCAVSKITGPKGTKVTLKMHRPSTDKVWDVVIVRDRIVVQPLRGWRRNADGKWDYLIDPANRIGYAQITAFTESSGPDLDAALKELEKEGLNGLVLDLRYNRGGFFESAKDVVDLFVSEGFIVKSIPRSSFAKYEIAHRRGTHPDYPLVVLINEVSASASEIVAGALQDVRHKRATLVGQRSYGKGSVLAVTPQTGGGSQFTYTMAYYHLPSDQQVRNRYQVEKQGRKDWGIAPDVDVEVSDREIVQTLDVQRDNDVLFRAGHQENNETDKRHSLAQTLDSDPQLAVALLVVQSKMVNKGITLKLPEQAAGQTVVAKDGVEKVAAEQQNTGTGAEH